MKRNRGDSMLYYSILDLDVDASKEEIKNHFLHHMGARFQNHLCQNIRLRHDIFVIIF